MSEAALQQNWTQVAALRGDGLGLTPVERMLAGHADLALNRNNESLANFLSVTTLGELGQWSDWARGLREQNPTNAIACYLEGDALARLHQWPTAIAAFTAGLDLAPGHPLLLNARGVSFAATWDMTHAMVDLKAATLRNPRLADAFVSLGSMWVQQQRASSGAMVALDKALELSPNSAVALTLRSGVRMVQGDFPASQLDVTQAMKDAGQLTTAVQARLLDMASLVRGGPAKEVQQALASGANPGMLINRELQNLQQGQLGSMDRLMTIAQMFPDQRPAISSGIQNTASSSASAMQSVTAGFTRMGQADMLTKTAGSVTNLALGTQYAMSIGLSQDFRMNFTPSPTPSPRPDFSSLANNMNNAATLAGAMSDLTKIHGTTSLTFGAAGQGLGLFGAAFADNGRVNFSNQQTREQFVNTGVWGLSTLADQLKYEGSSPLSRWQVSPSFSNATHLASPAFQIAEAFTSQIGQGRWLPNQTEQSQYLSGAHDLLMADFNLRFPSPSTLPLGSLGMATRVGYGLGFALTSSAANFLDFAGSPNTLSGQTSLMDGFARLSPLAVMITPRALALAAPEFAVALGAASVASSLIGSSSGPLRDLAMPLSLWGNNDAALTRSRIVDTWSLANSSSIMRGQTPTSFSQFMGGWTNAVGAGFMPGEIARLDNLVPPRHDVTTTFSSGPTSFSFDTFAGHHIAGIGETFQTTRFNSIDPLTSTQTISQHYSYTDAFSGALANQSIPRADANGPFVPPTPKPTYTPPTPSPDFTNFLNSVKQSVGNSVGYGSGANPGGFRTGLTTVYWEDGEWPITPWYGLGYVVIDRPAQATHEDKQ
jgi:tetratricopeptide (TPR) repeat protein